jgi:hypothetical protein
MFTAAAIALEGTKLSIVIRSSPWLFAAAETVHVIAIALVVGLIAVLDLRLLGLSWRRRPVTEVAQDVLAWTWGCFGVAVVAGLLMFLSGPSKYLADTPFKIKMALLICAGLNMALFHLLTYRNVEDWNTSERTPWSAKIAAGLSLLFWIAIVACGRMVSFTTQDALFGLIVSGWGAHLSADWSG